MVTIGKIPKKLQSFFRPLQSQFTRPAWLHFWGLVLALSISHGATLDRLAKRLRGSTHRTNHGEFLWRSVWDEPTVIQQIALDLLKRLYRKDQRRCYLIIDETQTLKRARKMAGVGQLFHHASGQYATGHTLLKVCLWYRGVTIPWGSWLYLKKADAPKQKVPFRKLTQLAAEAIEKAPLPGHLRITVLFDAYYLCPTVALACAQRGWHYIGVGKSNRALKINGVKHRLDRYGRNLLGRRGKWYKLQGLRKSGSYRLAQRIGYMKNLGRVKVVFSRRRREHKIIALVTDDLRGSMQTVVADYLKRWAIELLIKDEKQQLGLGDYRVLRYQAVVRHLHLVDCAYACLTHLALREASAQGRQKNHKVLRLAPISQLKVRMQQMVWREMVEDVIKHSHEKPVIRRLEKLLAA